MKWAKQNKITKEKNCVIENTHKINILRERTKQQIDEANGKQRKVQQTSKKKYLHEQHAKEKYMDEKYTETLTHVQKIDIT